jgi:AAA family ATP:ADP antiporter
MSSSSHAGQGKLHAIVSKVADVRPYEVRALVLAFLCNFVLMASYYLLRPVRDAMATVFGVDQLQNLFTGTLLLTLVCSPIFAWLTDTFKLSRLLPAVFAFLVVDIVAFYFWFQATPDSRWLAAAFYWWFSVVNLFMVSVFWSLMVDLFTPNQASRLLPAITGGGSLGAIAGPLVAALFVKGLGVSGVLLLAAAGLVVVIVIVIHVIREKRRLQEANEEAQPSSMDRKLRGSFLDGFRVLLTSSYQINQALFILLMTWIATIGYFLQTDLIAKAFADVASRTQALADIDLAVNICSAIVSIFGLSRMIARFGVTGSLVLNPILMAISFVLMVFSPTLLMLQAMQALRRVTQYAIARPSREICFTVVEQENRYKTKNIIDVVVYRLGDLSSAWMQAGLRSLGMGLNGTLGVGVLASGIWAISAWTLGRQYEQRKAAQSGATTELTALQKC